MLLEVAIAGQGTVKFRQSDVPRSGDLKEAAEDLAGKGKSRLLAASRNLSNL